MSSVTYHNAGEVVRDVAELACHVAREDVSAAAEKVVDMAEKTMNATKDATDECLRNSNWDPDPGC